MFKGFEVLEVYADRYGDIEDVDHIGEIQVNIDEEDFYEVVRAELENLGIDIPESWDIVRDDEMGLVSIYDSKGKYRYQLRDY